uniref:Uncharacterized protein n=1 Tax=Ascaris lumbricoides TaxID=6252 RepID=A0A0M3HYE8_ASCLU
MTTFSRRQENQRVAGDGRNGVLMDSQRDNLTVRPYPLDHFFDLESELLQALACFFLAIRKTASRAHKLLFHPRTS